ncbi:MAG: phenylacetic acid degradation operon negative regulatory protein PaaX [Burkholderiales bacterium]|nr:phenylacetic acid degradation operon negative regulatory protein PaaX [Burkholderiales bacterium]
MTLATVQKRLAALHQQSRVAAGSLIVSVFGDAVLPRGGGIWLGSLIGLMEVLGLNERLVRTSVFRLVKDEWLQTQVHGRRSNYLLTPVGRRRFEEASAHIYAARAPQWDHRWRLVSVVGELDLRTREAVRRSMAWQGFGELSMEVFVHPSADLGACMESLQSDGLRAVLPKLLPLMANHAGLGNVGTDADMVQRAWNLNHLAQGYLEFGATYQPVLDEVQVGGGKRLDGATAFLARALMIHDYRRLLLRDPELPAELLPSLWPGEQARALCRTLYQRLLPDSEAYLDQQLQLADGAVPAATAVLELRFATQT